jgi:hypothetical protein
MLLFITSLYCFGQINNRISGTYFLTTIELPNKAVFDEWIKELKNLIYNFIKIKGLKKMLIFKINSSVSIYTFGLENHNKLSDCRYEISIKNVYEN